MANETLDFCFCFVREGNGYWRRWGNVQAFQDLRKRGLSDRKILYARLIEDSLPPSLLWPLVAERGHTAQKQWPGALSMRVPEPAPGLVPVQARPKKALF